MAAAGEPRTVAGIGLFAHDVRVPGSKSLTNRALVLAALASGTSTLEMALRSDDTDVLSRALASLGAAVEAVDEVFDSPATPGGRHPAKGRIAEGKPPELPDDLAVGAGVQQCLGPAFGQTPADQFDGAVLILWYLAVFEGQVEELPFRLWRAQVPALRDGMFRSRQRQRAALGSSEGSPWGRAAGMAGP